MDRFVILLSQCEEPNFINIGRSGVCWGDESGEALVQQWRENGDDVCCCGCELRAVSVPRKYEFYYEVVWNGDFQEVHIQYDRFVLNTIRYIFEEDFNPNLPIEEQGLLNKIKEALNEKEEADSIIPEYRETELYVLK